MSPHTAPPLTIAVMDAFARANGFAWSPEELEALRPAVERALAGVRALESVPLGDIEPTVQYRVI